MNLESVQRRLGEIVRAIGDQSAANTIADWLGEVTFHGWCEFTFPHMEESFHRHRDSQLEWIAQNQKHPKMPEEAADWLCQMLHAGGPPQSVAKKFADAMKNQKVGRSAKTCEVIAEVGDFVREQRRWPMRSEIVIEGVSSRARDLAFEEIGRAFFVKFDAREKWTDPQ